MQCTEPEVNNASSDELIEIRIGNQPTYKRRCVAPKVTKVAGGFVYRFIKRAFDLLASLFAIILLAIPMAVIAICIKLDSPGPVLYKQERLGKDQKPFWVLKFRSMRVDAEAAGAQWASDNDPRVTKTGAILRKFRLDELPQFFCVLTGRMSLVGPRPERPVFYDEFDKYLDGFRQRMLVTPGLTGLAQVSGGYDLDPEEKIVYDVQYIETRSLLTDLKIIFKTVAVIFSHDGAH